MLCKGTCISGEPEKWAALYAAMYVVIYVFCFKEHESKISRALDTNFVRNVFMKKHFFLIKGILFVVD